MLLEHLHVVQEASQNYDLLPGIADISDGSMNADEDDVDQLPENILQPKQGCSSYGSVICA